MFNNLAFAIQFAGIGNILLALVVLLFMITIHELGHYTAGKLLNFKINEFAIGMGPKLFSRKTKSGEVVSLRALPLGGFCAFEGENEEGNNANSFNKQKPWKRIVVLFSGALFNFVSAILIAVVVFSCYGDTVMVVNNVYEYAATENKVLEPGDVIYKVDGKEVYISANFSSYIKNDVFDLTVIRDGQEVELKGLKYTKYVTTSVMGCPVTATSDDGKHNLVAGDTLYKIDGKLVVGEGSYQQAFEAAGDTVDLVVLTADGNFVTFSQLSKAVLSQITPVENSYTGIGMATTYQKMKYSFVDSLLRSVPYCLHLAWFILQSLGGIITGVVGLSEVGGPLTTISVASQVVASGFGNVLSMIVMISVNLAVFNLLPVPALDGCQIIFVLIEAIRKKPINRNVQGIINTVGLVALMIFVVMIDLIKL